MEDVKDKVGTTSDRMDEQFILVIRDGLGRGEDEIIPFNAPTPNAARGKARGIVIKKQGEKVNEFPYSSPIVVKGKLFWGLLEIDGSEFIKVENEN